MIHLQLDYRNFFELLSMDASKEWTLSDPQEVCSSAYRNWKWVKESEKVMETIPNYSGWDQITTALKNKL